MKKLFELNKEYNLFLISIILFTLIGFAIGFIYCYLCYGGNI